MASEPGRGVLMATPCSFSFPLVSPCPRRKQGSRAQGAATSLRDRLHGGHVQGYAAADAWAGIAVCAAMRYCARAWAKLEFSVGNAVRYEALPCRPWPAKGCSHVPRRSRKPDFFIVGAPKSATTSMMHYLAQHPEVFIPLQEPRFFGRDITHDGPRITYEDYMALFEDVTDEKRIGEKSVWYLYSGTAAEEIHAFNPEARILVLLRNPADMLYSLHGQFVGRSARENIADFEEALAAEPERRRGLRVPSSVASAEHLLYSEIPRYFTQLQRYLRFFPRERIHVVLYDDLQHDPGTVYGEVLRFLEVDDRFVPDFRVYNPARNVHSPRLRRMLLAGRPAGRWIGARAPAAMSRILRRWYGALGAANVSERPRSALSPHVRARIDARMAPEIDALGEFLGRDLSHWASYRRGADEEGFVDRADR